MFDLAFFNDLDILKTFIISKIIAFPILTKMIVILCGCSSLH